MQHPSSTTLHLHNETLSQDTLNSSDTPEGMFAITLSQAAPAHRGLRSVMDDMACGSRNRGTWFN
jgi:hypothetical protein